MKCQRLLFVDTTVAYFNSKCLHLGCPLGSTVVGGRIRWALRLVEFREEAGGYPKIVCPVILEEKTPLGDIRTLCDYGLIDVNSF